MCTICEKEKLESSRCPSVEDGYNHYKSYASYTVFDYIELNLFKCLGKNWKVSQQIINGER